ncbi:hypothetical protein D3C83_124230 [compost metagenome]
MNERDLELPDFADGPDRELVRGLVPEDLKARCLDGGHEIVDAHGRVALLSLEAIGQCSQREKRLGQG